LTASLFLSILQNIYLLSNSNQNATDDYTKVIHWQPNNAEAYQNRGRAHALRGDQANAVADLDKAVSLGRRT
jgi:Flp pilus assembly protein TadD